MARVEQSVQVGVPVPVAYRQWTRVEEFPLFVRGVLRVERPESGLTRWTVRTGGAIREFDARVTERIEDERIAWASVTGDLRQTGVVTFHRLDERRTTVMLQLDVRPGRLADRLAVVLGFTHRRVLDGLLGFKEFAEAQAARQRR
ncbi:SRPBCC family protein [Kitasatospora sp. NPDC085879]|uniref:SRPBCC family protein n=1 Tax=Kitasatospora sp. NPDC085879 TaxID=3154769 RepID=UPI000BB0DADF|nr:SRPBCC family protein [Streptomyces sp. TLI_235]PBC76031.1 polyketide cyclase/dehydrase/lipid transport protein [Streptomyces sp. TLI_235]